MSRMNLSTVSLHREGNHLPPRPWCGPAIDLGHIESGSRPPPWRRSRPGYTGCGGGVRRIVQTLQIYSLLVASSSESHHVLFAFALVYCIHSEGFPTHTATIAWDASGKRAVVCLPLQKCTKLSFSLILPSQL